MHIARKVDEAAGQLRGRGIAPEKALVLEARLSGFSNELSGLSVVPFRKIRSFPEPIVSGRSGSLLFGQLDGVAVVVQEGMVHLYEGYLPGEIGFPVRVLAALGARKVVFIAEGRLLQTGAEQGEMMLVADHLDLTGTTPLKGIREEERTPFIEPSEVDDRVRVPAAAAARAAGVALDEGVAAFTHGPAWPTPAEARMLRGFGADAVTMALGPELAMAAHLGIETAAFLVLGNGASRWGNRYLEFCKRFVLHW